MAHDEGSESRFDLLASLLQWRARGAAFARTVIFDDPDLVDVQDSPAMIFFRLRRAVALAATVHQELLNLDMARLHADTLRAHDDLRREKKLLEAQRVMARLEELVARAEAAVRALEASGALSRAEDREER